MNASAGGREQLTLTVTIVRRRPHHSPRILIHDLSPDQRFLDGNTHPTRHLPLMIIPPVHPILAYTTSRTFMPALKNSSNLWGLSETSVQQAPSLACPVEFRDTSDAPSCLTHVSHRGRLYIPFGVSTLTRALLFGWCRHDSLP